MGFRRNRFELIFISEFGATCLRIFSTTVVFVSILAPINLLTLVIVHKYSSLKAHILLETRARAARETAAVFA